MKSVLLSIAALLFFVALLAPAKAAVAEDTVLCSFTGQVVNIETTQSLDQYGNPEVADLVYFGYWKFNRIQNRMEGIATHYVFATKEWTPDLRAAYFDPRRPTILINSELYAASYDNCYSLYRGTVYYINVNPSFRIQENSGGGGGGGMGKGSPEKPGKK